MEKIGFDKDGIGHFIADNFLKVPVYQRSFAWEIPNVHDLFEDIKYSYPEEYFIGTIVVTGKGNNLEIVDGQQRLATINIFFTAVRDFLKENNIGKSKHIESEYICRESLRDEDKKHKLVMNNADNDFYLKRIIGNESNVIPSKESHQRILEAYNYTKDLVRKKYDKEGADGIYDLVDFIHEDLKIIIVRVSDDVNAFTIFETLNDRGLVLSQTDLIKNYLFNKSDNRLEEAKGKWAGLTGAIESAENEEEILQYIRYYWSSKNGLVREKKLFEDIKNKIRNKNQTITFLSNLEINTEKYLALLNPNHSLWRSYPTECAMYIGEIKELGLTQNRPLLLALLEKFSNKEEAEKSLKLITSWSIRNLITGVISAGTLEREFSNQAKQINDGAIKNTRGLKTLIKPLSPTDEQFKNAFEIATVSKSNIARYYLRKLEGSYRATSELSPLTNPEKVNLEHILPEIPRDLRADWLEFDENKHKTYYRRLGNLTLLDTRMNANVGNGNFSIKKGVYKRSDIVITKKLSKINIWSPTGIEERQKGFAEKAIEIWSMD